MTNQTQNGNYVSKDILEALIERFNDQQQLTQNDLIQKTNDLIQKTKQHQVSEHMLKFSGLHNRKGRNDALINLFNGLDENRKTDVWRLFSATDENDFLKTIIDANHANHPKKDDIINLTGQIVSDIVNSDSTIDIGRLLGSPS